MNIVIDREFKNLIPPLSKEEYEGLKQSILSEGCRDALIIWGDILLDGHNRYELCTTHDIPFNVKQMEFDDRNDAKLWMMKNQLARRNLNDFQRIEIVDKCKDAVRAKAKERQGTRTDVANIPLKSAESRDELAKMSGVGHSTYEHAVTVMESAPEPVIDAVRHDDLSINAAYEVTKMEPEEQREVVERIESGEKPKTVVNEVKNRPHVSFNSGNNEWYTPANIIEAARLTMGSIDLDPATSEIAQETVKADKYYTVETNGLDKSWHGNVWMNPPYSSELIGQFIDKLVAELQNIKQAIVLVNNATETEWFNKLIDKANMVCFPRSRVKFYMPEGKTGAPLQGQAILYFGENKDSFIEHFSESGWIADVVHR